MPAILQIKGLSKNFGGLVAVNDLTFDVNRGEIFGLVGPNGAGKSTVLNIIGGTYLPSRGEIIYREENITRLLPYQRCQRGIARVFQKNVLFGSFSVVENVILGLHRAYKTKISEIFFKQSINFKRDKLLYEEALQILQLVGLEKEAGFNSKSISYGKQRLLSLAIALATRADLLLLDEPLTGMTMLEIKSIVELIKNLRAGNGITFVVVEHNMKAVVDLCDRIAVLEFGKKIAEDIPSIVVKDPRVIEAYLGKE